MKRGKYFAGVAVLVLGLAGSMFAQAGSETPQGTEKKGTSDLMARMACCPHNDAAAHSAVPANAKEERAGDLKDDSAPAKADDSNKGPYWEPRDWTYIYNQGP